MPSLCKIYPDPCANSQKAMNCHGLGAVLSLPYEQKEKCSVMG